MGAKGDKGMVRVGSGFEYFLLDLFLKFGGVVFWPLDLFQK
jgi:hypothetical protein